MTRKPQLYTITFTSAGFSLKFFFKKAKTRSNWMIFLRSTKELSYLPISERFPTSTKKQFGCGVAMYSVCIAIAINVNDSSPSLSFLYKINAEVEFTRMNLINHS